MLRKRRCCPRWRSAVAPVGRFVRGFPGHSHYQNTRHPKATVDAKRATAFHRLSREVTAAIATGGADPSCNIRLARALDNARRANMPKARLQRALEIAKQCSSAAAETTVFDVVLQGGIAARICAFHS